MTRLPRSVIGVLVNPRTALSLQCWRGNITSDIVEIMLSEMEIGRGRLSKADRKGAVQVNKTMIKNLEDQLDEDLHEADGAEVEEALQIGARI